MERANAYRAGLGAKGRGKRGGDGGGGAGQQRATSQRSMSPQYLPFSPDSAILKGL